MTAAFPFSIIISSFRVPNIFSRLPSWRQLPAYLVHTTLTPYIMDVCILIFSTNCFMLRDIVVYDHRILRLIVMCEVTGWRHRVSPCRSAYYASPRWLLTFCLRRRRREAALLFPESWWILGMWGSPPSHFMIIPNTKRHPNNTKTDQLHISEVITGFPRPYHNTSPPWWAAYAEIWQIRGNPGSPN